MKKRSKIIIASILAAVIIAAAPTASFAPVTLTAEAANVTIPDNYGVKAVKKTGELTVKVPENVSGSYEVKAYEMLRLVVPEDSTDPDSMTNDDNSKNVYYVTDPFVDFFNTAKKAYNDTDATVKLYEIDTLYLTYDTSDKCLKITATEPDQDKKVNEDYIVIDNRAYQKDTNPDDDIDDSQPGRLDKKYFEADLVSRIADSNPISGETNASAARLLSDWASRYIKAKELSADATAQKVRDEEDDSKVTGFKFSNLVYGYYVVVTNDDSQDNDKSVINQSILNVPQAENVTLKATPITIDKSVSNLVDANRNNNGENDKSNSTTTRIDEDIADGKKYDKLTANIGDVLQYRIESHIPSLTSYDLSDTTKLVDIGTEIKASDFETDDKGKFIENSAIKDKYVYIFRDTMTNQDFIPVDTKVSGVTVSGLKMEITYKDSEGQDRTATYVVKNFGENTSPEYYLVAREETNKANAIGRLWETDYTTASKKNFFAINFDLTKLKALKYDGRNIVFTYNAELKGEAGNNNSTNTATFTYSNDPFDLSSTDTISDSDEVYTYDLKIDKLFSDGATTDFYKKVTFKLYSQDSSVTSSSSVTSRKAINFVKTSDGIYTRADSDDPTITNVLAINPEDGKLLLHGLGEGTYYLEEQKNDDLTGAGYNIVNPIKIVVTAKDENNNITDSENFDLFKQVNVEGTSTDTTATTATLDNVNLPLKAVSNEYGVEFDVINQKGFKLPLTGEYGNWALAIAGILIVAVSGTVIVLANRKKKDTTADNEA